MKNIYIIGAGGHAKVVADIIIKIKSEMHEKLELKGFLDDNYNNIDKRNIFGIEIIGKVEKIEELKENEYNYFIIGIGGNRVREEISRKYNVKYYTAIHPSAVIGNEVELGVGTVVMANCVVNSSTKIGEHCIINSSSVIEHDNIIKNYVHISPKVSTAGNVTIEEKAWVGIGSTVIQGIKIGKESLIGAGSVVVKNIGANVKAFGNPCREVDKI